MLRNLRRLIAGFSRGDQVRLVAYLVGQFVASLLDLLGVAVVLPILQILSGTAIDTGVIGSVHRLLGQPDRRSFVVMLCVAVIVAFVLKSALSLALQWWSSGFVARLTAASQQKLMTHFLQIDYLDYRRASVGDLARSVGSAVTDAHSKVLGGALSVVTWGAQTVMLMVFLLVAVPVPAMVTLIYLGIVVLVLQRVLGPLNRRAGERAHELEWQRSVAIVEAFRGLRDVRLHNAQRLTVDRFDALNRQTAQVGRKANFLGGLPRQVLELTTVIGLVLLLLSVALTSGEHAQLATLGIFVATTLKVLPAITSITASIGVMRQGQAGLADTVATLSRIGGGAEHSVAAIEPARVDVAPTRVAGRSTVAGTSTVAGPSTLAVRGVSFRYPDGTDDVVSEVSFEVPPGTSLAICGSSGSGKTTLADMVLSLFRADRGQVTYGGRDIWSDLATWRETVAYVPQDVYLFDGSVLNNIAFGVPDEHIDRARVAECVAAVQLTGVVAELPEGLNSAVGERGIRLSGGQRQRVGIARALYRSPQVLVLDEATSALDNATERDITDTLSALGGQVSTIVIAHRLSTVRQVDQLIFMQGGCIAARGTFAEVQRQSADFAELVRLGSLEPAPLQAKDLAQAKDPS